MKSELYISIDIESNGPIPGINSMLSLGAAAISKGKIVSSFGENLLPLPGAVEDRDTMLDFWDRNPLAYLEATRNQQSPEEVMQRFVNWVDMERALYGGTPVLVGYPLPFDFMFTYWYLIRFVGYSPFSFSGIDVKTLGMQLLQCGYRGVGKRALCKALDFTPPTTHSHIAEEDAQEQGEIFIKLCERVAPWLLV